MTSKKSDHKVVRLRVLAVELAGFRSSLSSDGPNWKLNMTSWIFSLQRALFLLSSMDRKPAATMRPKRSLSSTAAVVVPVLCITLGIVWLGCSVLQRFRLLCRLSLCVEQWGCSTELSSLSTFTLKDFLLPSSVPMSLPSSISIWSVGSTNSDFSEYEVWSS